MIRCFTRPTDKVLGRNVIALEFRPTDLPLER